MDATDAKGGGRIAVRISPPLVIVTMVVRDRRARSQSGAVLTRASTPITIIVPANSNKGCLFVFAGSKSRFRRRPPYAVCLSAE